MNQFKLNIELIRRAFLHKRNEKALYVYLHLIHKSAGKGWVDTKEFIKHMKSVSGKSSRSIYRWVRHAKDIGVIVTNDRVHNRIVVKGKKRFKEEWNEGKDNPITSRLCMAFEEDFFKLNYKEFISCLYERFGVLKQEMIEYVDTRTKKKESSDDSLNQYQGFNQQNYNLKESESYQKTYGCSISLLSKFIGVPYSTIQRNTCNCKKESRYHIVDTVTGRDMFLPWSKYPISLFKENPRLSFKKIGEEYEIRLRLADRWATSFTTLV